MCPAGTCRTMHAALTPSPLTGFTCPCSPSPPHRLHVPLQRCQAPAGARVPEPGERVESRTEHQRAVGVEGDGVDRAAVALLQQHLLTAGQVPQAPRGVEGGSCQEAARGMEGEASEAVDVA